MICDECKKCANYNVCELGCYGSDIPCEYLNIDNSSSMLLRDKEVKCNGFWKKRNSI